MTIRWLPPAVENLDIIYNFYYRQQPGYAQNLYEKIIKETNMLLQFPRMASKELLLERNGRGFRSLIISKQVKVVYYIKDEIIYIADIWPCRQNPVLLTKRISGK